MSRSAGAGPSSNVRATVRPVPGASVTSWAGGWGQGPCALAVAVALGVVALVDGGAEETVGDAGVVVDGTSSEADGVVVVMGYGGRIAQPDSVAATASETTAHLTSGCAPGAPLTPRTSTATG